MAGIVRAVLTQTYQGQECTNVFHYQYAGTGLGKAVAVVNHFTNTLLPSINTIQNVGVKNISTYAINITNIIDYASSFYTGDGDVGTADSGLSPFVAYKFSFQLSPSLIKRGFKRFVGCDESMVAAGGINSGSLATFNLVASKLGQVFVASGDTFTPGVARYSGPLPVSTYLFTDIIGTFVAGLTSQNTRKR